MSNDLHTGRRKMFESIGKRLLADLEAATNAQTDTEIQGRAGESALRQWLSLQLPNRVKALTGAVLSAADPPTTERDCVLFDSDNCPSFRQSGGAPDLLPVEGILGCLEVNTGTAGASTEKVIRDFEKLSDVGRLCRRARQPLAKAVKLGPLEMSGASTIQQELFALKQEYRLPPLLYLFAEDVRCSLATLTNHLCNHNKSVDIGNSVGGVFVLNKGMILHITPGEGWAHARFPQSPLAFIAMEPWEVLLKMMSIVWNFLWKCDVSCSDLGQYYADKMYFQEQEEPHTTVLEDSEYIDQIEEGFLTVR